MEYRVIELIKEGAKSILGKKLTHGELHEHEKEEEVYVG